MLLAFCESAVTAGGFPTLVRESHARHKPDFP